MSAELRIVAAKLDQQERRSDYDVTNTVRVSSPRAVARAVRGLLERMYPHASFDSVWLAFQDFERLYTGRDPDYHAVDTTYHDIQHTLDVTLAAARLIAGHELSVNAGSRLGAERATFILVAALFHDAGYIRHRKRDRNAENGAEFTRTHVTRSGRYLERYLPKIGLEEFTDVVARVVHYTGYEMRIEDIELDDARDCLAGELLGTADLLAQMADRCYLEKCRDRLYPEFVLGRVAVSTGAAGSGAVYQSGRDLLEKTMTFYHSSARRRLEKSFNRAYRYLEAVFDDGSNPYMEFIDKNLAFLEWIKANGDWSMLRRRPPCAVPDPAGEARMMALALKRLRTISTEERTLSRQVRALDPDRFAPD